MKFFTLEMCDFTAFKDERDERLHAQGMRQLKAGNKKAAQASFDQMTHPAEK